jgi:hypothetical protein
MRCAVKCQSPSDERSAGNPHATFCGSRGRRAAAPGDPVRGQQCPRLLGNVEFSVERAGFTIVTPSMLRGRSACLACECAGRLVRLRGENLA